MREDLIAIIAEIIRLNNDPTAQADDIDHLGNRRVRAVGELVQNKLRVGLARMSRNIKDRMSTCEIETVVPGQLINSRPVAASTKEFFHLPTGDWGICTVKRCKSPKFFTPLPLREGQGVGLGVKFQYYLTASR